MAARGGAGRPGNGMAGRGVAGLGGAAGARDAIARAGGIARASTMSPEHRRRLAVAGAKAGWAKLTPEQAAEKRRRSGEAANRAITHEQRVANGKLGALRRHGV